MKKPVTRPTRKRVVCTGHGPIFFGPQYRSPWEDVWVRWRRGKPSAGPGHVGPCLQSANELRAEIRMHEDIRNRPDDADLRIKGLSWSSSTFAERQGWYRTDDAVAEQVLGELETQPYADDGDKWPSAKSKPSLANIYTKANGIDRAEAERMLAYYLEKHYGLRNVRFVWKRPAYCVTPMGFGEYGG